GVPIGLDMAQALGWVGVEVTLLNHETVLGKARDPDVHSALQAAVAQDVTLRLGCNVSASRHNDGVRIAWQPTGEGEAGAATFGHVLIATGRAPALDGL
ncbi:MAG: FAD-dependent oxidoreductase, partial [Paracoccus sp. (in: a-proteobacteria)]